MTFVYQIEGCAYYDTRHRKHTKCFSFEQHPKEYRTQKVFLRYYVKSTGTSFIYNKKTEIYLVELGIILTTI